MAEKYKSAVSLAMVVLLGIGLQVILGFADNKDTPSKAAVEFAKAYFWSDPGMKERLCSTLVEGEEGDVATRFINAKYQEAQDLGYSTCWLGDGLKHIITNTLEQDENTARVELKAEAKNGFRAFFTKESAYEIHEEFDLVKEDGVWKVCGNPFQIAGADYVPPVTVAEQAEGEEEAAEDAEESEETEESEDEESDEEHEDESEEESEDDEHAEDSEHS